VGSAELPSALAVNEARSHLALMAGQPLGGFLFGLGKAAPYIVNMLAPLGAIFALSMMDKKNYQPYDADKSSVSRPDRSRISFLCSVKKVILSPFLRTVVVACAVGNFFFQVVVLLLVVLAEQQHLSSARIGLLLASSGIGGLVGSIVAPIVGKRVRDEQNVMICVLAWAALTFVVAVSAQPVVGLLAWGGLSITGGSLNVAIITHQARHVPEQMLGQVVSINRFLTSGAVPLGALSAGYIIAELHPHAAAWLVFAAIAALACAVPVLLRPRKLLPNRMVDRMKKWLTPPEAADPHPFEEIRERTPEPV
jgi:predicted MFS family arabinose efflux permease